MMNKLNVEYMGIETLIPYINNEIKNDKAIDVNYVTIYHTCGDSGSAIS